MRIPSGTNSGRVAAAARPDAGILLAVNTVQTKVQLPSGERTQQAALLAAQRAQLHCGGHPLGAFHAFKYLITFSSATCF